jgi:DNA-binding NarL/FixJ family response regulator
MAGTGEKRLTQIFFQRSHLARNRALRQCQLLRRMGLAFVPGSGLKAPQKQSIAHARHGMPAVKCRPPAWILVLLPLMSVGLVTMSAVSFLISDPSPALQTFTQQLLSGYGFDAAAIKTTSNPHAAAEIAASLRPDFLITDWFAKESLTGIALHQAVQKIQPDCHFALLSSLSDTAHQQEAEKAGALFLLAKPFTADAMRSALRTALEQLAQLHPSIAQKLSAQTNQSKLLPAPIQMPSLPQYKPGDRVVYANRTEVVKNVILRRGELVLQLDGIPGMVEADKITPR